MKKIIVRCLIVFVFCLFMTACDQAVYSPYVEPDTNGEILSMPCLTQIGVYNVECVSLIPNSQAKDYTLNVCLRTGLSFDYANTLVSVKVDDRKIELELLINNSNWALYSASDVEYAESMRISVEDTSGIKEKEISLDKTRYERYQNASVEGTWGLCARAYISSEKGSLIFLEFSESVDNAFLEHFIKNFDIVTAGAEMVYVDQQNREIDLTGIGGMMGIHPFTNRKETYLILRPENPSNVVGIRVKSIYISKSELTKTQMEEFDRLLSVETEGINVMVTDTRYIVQFDNALNIPVS